MPQLLRYLSKSLVLGSSFTRVKFINIIYYYYMGEEFVSKLIHRLKWYQPLVIIASDFFVDFCMLHNGYILLFSYLFSCFFVAFLPSNIFWIHLIFGEQYWISSVSDLFQLQELWNFSCYHLLVLLCTVNSHITVPYSHEERGIFHPSSKWCL